MRERFTRFHKFKVQGSGFKVANRNPALNFEH
jgi:hypothetical protein